MDPRDGIVLSTEVDDQCDKPAVDRQLMSSVIRSERPASSSTAYVTTIDKRWQSFVHSSGGSTAVFGDSLTSFAYNIKVAHVV